MGKRGPAGKPDELKRLQGNPGKRPLNNNAPKYPKFDIDDLPTPPSWLNTPAKKEWKRLIPILHQVGVLSKADTGAMAAYCQAFGEFVEATKLVKAKGYTTVTDKGNVVRRPEVGIANTAMKLMVSIAREFGMTPSARSNVDVEKVEDQKDPFVVFIGGKKNA